MFRNRELLFVMTVIMLWNAGFFSNVTHVFAASETEARDAVETARSTFLSDYLAVADAGKTGANTSDLLVVLNNAGDLLSRADLAFARADYDSAFAFATESQRMLNGFSAEASVLKDSAAQKSYADFLISIVGSVLGTVAVVLGSLVVWRVLKRRYVEAGSVQVGS